MVKILTTFILTSSFNFAINTRADSTIMNGVRAFYNYDFERSIKILDKARIDYPRHPGIHFIWASSKYYISQGVDPIEATYDTLESVLNEIQPIYQKLVSENPQNAEYKLYLGSTLGMRARVSLGRKEWLSVLNQAYRGFNIIEDVSKNRPDLIDAQLPIGIIGYYASVSNVFLRWLVKLYGLDTSKKEGIYKIEDAATNSDWAWIEASGILSFIYLWIENKPEDAIPITKNLSEEFPNNFYFNILYLESLTRTNSFNNANNLIKDLDIRYTFLSGRQKEWYKPYFDYQKALISFLENDYDKAMVLADLAIKDYSGELDVILGNLYLLKGKLYDLYGQRSKSVKYYKLCAKLDNLSHASRIAKNYLEKPYSNIIK